MTHATKIGNDLGGGKMVMEAKTNGNVVFAAKVGAGILAVGALAASVIFPFGLGVVAFAWIIALTGATIGASVLGYHLVKDILTGAATFNYSPTAAYLTGKKGKKAEKEATEEKAEKN